MPAVQTAFGPIVEPGWPDLKGPDMGAKFLSGAYIMGNINAKTQALQNQMAQYALKAQGLEQENALNEKKFALAQQGQEQKYDMANWRADIAERRLQLGGDAFNLTAQKYEDRITGNQAMIGAAASLAQDGIGKDDPRYPDEFLRRVTAASAKGDPSVYHQLVQSNINDYNINANRQDAVLQRQEKMLLDKIGSKLYGDPTLHLTGPIEHPENYPEETSGGGWGWGNFGLPTYKAGEEKTGYRTGSITLPTGDEKPVKFKTTDITSLAKEWQALQQAKSKRLPVVDMPSLGIYSKPASTPGERADRIIADPNSSEQAKEAAIAYKQMHPSGD